MFFWQRGIFAKLDEIIALLKSLLNRRPDRHRLFQLAAFGEGKVQLMQNFSVVPGQQGKLTIQFVDANNVQRPLGAVPTAVNNNGIAGTVAPDGPQTATDANYVYDIGVPATANPGDSFNIHVEGVNPDGTVDPEDYLFTVKAPDDVKQIGTFV